MLEWKVDYSETSSFCMDEEKINPHQGNQSKFARDKPIKKCLKPLCTYALFFVTGKYLLATPMHNFK